MRSASGSSGSFPSADGTGRRRSMGDKRVPGEELIAQLFEEMHALHFLADALEGGHFCLAVAMEKLPSKAAYLHLYDIDRREFVVVCTRGHGTEPLLLSRIGESDALLASAMRKRRAVVMNESTPETGVTVSRFAPVGGAKRIIVTPVMQAGRFLGAIEIVNPLDGAPFTEAEGNAITYMAEQYAEFVAARGVVLEPEKVSRASQNARA
jgi:GAF domain-containing protein